MEYRVRSSATWVNTQMLGNKQQIAPRRSQEAGCMVDAASDH